MLLPITSVAGTDKFGVLLSVDGFYDAMTTNTKQNTPLKDSINQKKTGYNNSCGPTSLLFLNSFFSKKDTGKFPSFTDSLSQSKDAVSRLYQYLGLPTNSITYLNHLKMIAQDKWGWSYVVRMSFNDSISTNMTRLMGYLTNNIPAIVVLSGSHPQNPVGGYDHIVIIYAYQKMKDSNGLAPTNPYNNRLNDRIYFFEPYFGKTGYFLRSEASWAIPVNNFAFLAISNK